MLKLFLSNIVKKMIFCFWSFKFFFLEKIIERAFTLVKKKKNCFRLMDSYVLYSANQTMAYLYWSEIWRKLIQERDISFEQFKFYCLTCFSVAIERFCFFVLHEFILLWEKNLVFLSFSIACTWNLAFLTFVRKWCHISNNRTMGYTKEENISGILSLTNVGPTKKHHQIPGDYKS